MGGTFDPIHHGHLVAASEVQSLFDLDEVIFVPTGQPWQKAERVVSEAEHRYLMTVIATASNPRFQVSRVDVDRAGPTYTIDTLRALHEAYDDAELFFITGADALAQILGWHAADELFALAHFVGVSRPGYERVDLSRFPDGAVTLLEVPALAISSTGCRARVAAVSTATASGPLVLAAWITASAPAARAARPSASRRSPRTGVPPRARTTDSAAPECASASGVCPASRSASRTPPPSATG